MSSNDFPPTSIPLGGVGAGSQPMEEDGVLEYMEMPKEMAIYAQPDLPEKEELVDMDAALKVLRQIHGLLKDYEATQKTGSFSVKELDTRNKELINQALGEGEVSVVGGERFQAQESVMAGIWRVREMDEEGNLVQDVIEIAPFPTAILANTFVNSAKIIGPLPTVLPNNVQNAPPLVTELAEEGARFTGKGDPHVINLTLLPQTEEDLQFMTDHLGQGDVIILSRGYGNCRITSTQTNNIWWVQYFNSQDTIILNTIEMSKIPEVACAALEDIIDSEERLGQILEVYA